MPHCADCLPSVFMTAGYGDFDPRLYPFYHVVGLHKSNALVANRPMDACGSCLEIQCVGDEVRPTPAAAGASLAVAARSVGLSKPQIIAPSQHAATVAPKCMHHPACPYALLAGPLRHQDGDPSHHHRPVRLRLRCNHRQRENAWVQDVSTMHACRMHCMGCCVGRGTLPRASPDLPQESCSCSSRMRNALCCTSTVSGDGQRQRTLHKVAALRPPASALLCRCLCAGARLWF